MREKVKKNLRQIILYSLSFISLASFSLISKIELILIVFLFFIFAYLKITEAKKARKARILQLSFLFVLGLSIAVFLGRYSNISPYYVPIAAIAMLAAILFSNLELAFLVSLCLSVCAGFIFNSDYHLMMVMFLGSIAGIFFVHRIRQRFKIIQAGIVVSLTMLSSLAIITFTQGRGVGLSFFTLPSVFASGINGILSAFIVAGALPVFEFLFNVLTNISLLELADFNHPLLKKLILEAPGTYHHSLLVGNLAEVASEAVGANALLARVGAYYHDIGKLEKPEYFSENQDRLLSRHQQLKASMSKLVILNHVKEGLELAKKYKLNLAISQFIQQHHGTSLVFYFYRRALEETKETKEIKEDVYRYPGPKPQTKETAIVLLADSVEAACRALDTPSVQRIEEVVHIVINNKFIDGQLDECELTLKDLTKIADTFIHILSAVYHSRVKYPQGKSEDNGKEYSKNNHG